MVNAANANYLARSRPELVSLLREEIAAAGRITFARFMEQALAHPEYGYYTAGDTEPGFEGDFLTAPETHPLFGALLARQLAECWERLGRPTPFVVREHGAGAGALALTTLAGLRDDRPDVLSAIRYELGDVNQTRVEAGLARAAEAGFGDHVFGASIEPITGVILANELLDALSVHRLVVEDRGVLEAFVGWRDGWFAEELGPVSDVRLLDSLATLPLIEGQRLEVSLAARDWTASTCREIERGYAILIDYGYDASELYDPVARRDGLLRTYWQHIAGDDPFDRVGRQDITAHVDFSAVSHAAEGAGCDILGLTTQAAFVAGLGVDDLLLRLQAAGDAVEYVRARETVMHLLDPRGLGRFRVLVLGRGVERDPPLRGLSFRWP